VSWTENKYNNLQKNINKKPEWKENIGEHSLPRERETMFTAQVRRSGTGETKVPSLRFKLVVKRSRRGRGGSI
jgi:hypothetical protein